MCVGVIGVTDKVVDQLRFVIDEVIHELLEYWWCIHETKGHDIHLLSAKGCDKCSEPFLSWFDSQLVVSQLHIKFGEVS